MSKVRSLVSIGANYQEWTVIGTSPKRNTIGRRFWLCRCICGIEREVVESNLIAGLSTSCGHRLDTSDLTGRRFNRWTVLRQMKSKNQRTRWLCRCICGNRKVLSRGDLTSGGSKSCGCLFVEVTIARNRARRKHSVEKLKSREYKSYRCMLDRCKNRLDYGGRGVKVCERWLDSFDNFLADMGPAPSYNVTIDRIDNDGNYEPSNCRWATCTQQNRNKRNNRKITLGTFTKTVSEWAETAGIGSKTIAHRLKIGWSIEEALSRPANLANRAIGEKEKALHRLALSIE